jgi:hypothetical protein
LKILYSFAQSKFTIRHQLIVLNKELERKILDITERYALSVEAYLHSAISTGLELYVRYNQVLSGLVNMINNPSPWLINR